MSSDTSSLLPAWKQALLDRKRHQENGGPSVATKADSTRTGTGSGVNTTQNTTEATTPATGSTWKQTTLSKKLQQYSTPSSSSSAPSTTEKETTGNRTDSTLNHTSGVTEIQVETVDDLPVEERLLPIKQNPILLSDRQKRRHHSKANHARSEKRSSRKSDPRATPSTKSAGSDEGMPSVSDGTVTPDASPAILTEDAGDEVFEEEVTYGKGFVHKLLKKFITLTGKDEPAPVVAPMKTQGSVRSVGDAPKGSTRSNSRSSASEKDSTEKKPSRLTVNSDVESSRRSCDEGTLPGTEAGDKTSKDMGSGVEVQPRPLSNNDQEPGQSNVVDAEDLPHNIVSAARDIFEHNTTSTSSVTSVRKKHGAPEKPTVDRSVLKRSAPEKPIVEVTIPDRSNVEPPAVNKQTLDRTADVSPSLKRTAPERPITEEIASGKNFSSWKSNLQNLAASSKEDSESNAPTISSEPAGKPSHNAPFGRVLYPAGVGPKNRVKLDNESNRDLKPGRSSNDNVKIDDGDRSIVQKVRTGPLPLPTVNSDKPETVSGNSVGVSKPGEEEANLTEEKPISVRAASKLYEAKNEKTQNSRFLESQTVEQRGTKNIVKPSMDSNTNKNTDSVNLSKPYVFMSVIDKEPTKEETKSTPVPATVVSETRVRNIDWRKPDDIDTMTRSDYNVTTTTQDLTSIRQTSTPLNVHVDAPVVTTGNVQPNQDLSDREQQKDNDVQPQDLTTRVRVGSYANAFEQKLQKSSAVENAPTIDYASNSVPSVSSIRTENQVTVIQIGSAGPAKLPGKLENVEAKPTVRKAEESKSTGGKVVNSDRPVNEQSSSSIGKKGVTIQVGNETDRIDTKIESLQEYNGIRGNNRNDSSTRYETKNDIRNDMHRNDTSSRNMTNSTKSVSRRTDDKGVSRPGMLLIRPASNLVASKTKTEYLTMTKYNDIKKGEFAPAKRPIPAEDMIMNGDVLDRGGSNLRGFEVVGGGVSIGRSLLAKTKRGKLSINFDDSALCTHEYPSEQSLMAATPAQPGDCDYVDENAPNSIANDNADDDDVSNDNDLKSADLLRSTPALAASGNLSSYVPRVQVDYEFGMLRSDDAVDVAPPSPDPESKSRNDAAAGLSESGEEDATWSQSSSADLLF